jgi:hypothetical protein
VDGPIIRFYSCFDSGVIVDVERNDDDEAEEYASSTADESTDSSAEDSYGEKLSKYLRELALNPPVDQC